MRSIGTFLGYAIENKKKFDEICLVREFHSNTDQKLVLFPCLGVCNILITVTGVNVYQPYSLMDLKLLKV